MESKKRLPMLARILGNRRHIIFVDSLPNDEIVYSCYKIYISSIYKNGKWR